MVDREKVIAILDCMLYHHEEYCQGRDCPYYKECNGNSVFKMIMPYEVCKDALALLKEQEPRVLTLEKIQSGTVEVAWLECNDKEEVRAGLWFKRINEGEDEGIIIHVLDGFEGLRTEVYGKTWRCWTSRPTPEQMRDTKWEEEAE